MSYSMREPDWPMVYECTYGEVRDEMDRENCPLHWSLIESPTEAATDIPQRKAPASEMSPLQVPIILRRKTS